MNGWTRNLATALGVALLFILTGCARPNEQTSTAVPTATPQAKNVSQLVRVSPEGTNAAEPAVAGGPDGTAYVAWVEHRPKSEADVWLAHVDADGKTSGPPVRVNPDAGGATAWHGDPPTLAVAPDGTLYIGWTARAAGRAHANTLYVSASRDGGRTFGPPSKVNDDTKPGPHGMHSLAVGPDGHVSVAWLDERNVAPPPPAAGQSGGRHTHKEPNREVFFASSSDGGRTFSPNRRVGSEVCPCCKTTLAAAPDGRVYVSWRQVLAGDFRHIAVASTADGGRSFSEPVVVSDDRWMIAGCPVSGAALAVGSDGALRVLWYTAGEAGPPGLYWSESRDGGRTFAPRRAFGESAGRGTPVLLRKTGGGFTAVWESNDQTAPITVMAGLGGDGRSSEPSTLAGGGELPAAAEAGGQFFVAYIGGGEGGRAIWLARTPAPA